MLDAKELRARVEAANEEFAVKEYSKQDRAAPTDVYQQREDARIENAKKSFPKGSSPLVMATVKALIDGDGGAGLALARKRAEDDSDSLAERGERERADIVKQQYMEERFLPAVEAVVEYTSPDEFLNCKEALAAMDKMALGTGKMKGYTAAYLRSAYGNQLGNRPMGSEPSVIDTVRKIKMLANDGQIRTAVGLAAKIKGQIDNGEKLASDDDYELIGRVAAYAS